MKIHTLTTLNIYEHQYEDLDYIDCILDHIKKSDLEYRNPGPDMGLAGYIKLENCVPYYDKKLFDWMQLKVDETTRPYVNNLKIKICDSWVVKTTFSQSSVYHKHNQSIFSGLLYLTDHISSETVFSYKNKVIEEYDKLLGGEEDQKFFRSKPKKGKLIIWPSFIPHRITNHTDFKNVRYTIAFNCFPTGLLRTTPTCQLNLMTESVEEKYNNYLNKLNKE